MKTLIAEIIEPLMDFYKMRKSQKKTELIIFLIIPIFIGIVLFIVEGLFDVKRAINIDEFVTDLLNQLITVLTLFISFSMAYLSIIITSSSNTINIMKEKNSKHYVLENKQCTLFQVLMSDLTYTLTIEIFFLIFIFFEKFLIYLCSIIGLRILISINVCLMVHVLILMLVTVKNIYFSFWKER